MNTLKRMITYLQPYRLDIILGFVALLIVTGAELLIPLQIQRVIDEGIAKQDNSVIISASLTMLGFALIAMVATYGNAFFAVRASENYIADVREETYRKVQTFSFGNLDQLQTGELLVRLTSDLNQIKMAILMSMRMLLRAPMMLIGALIILVITSPRLSLLLLVILPVTGGLVYWYSLRTQPLYKQVQERLDKVNTILQENIAGVRVVKAFVQGEREIGRFGEANNAYANKNIEVGLIVAMLFPSMLTIINLATAAVLWFGGGSGHPDRSHYGG